MRRPDERARGAELNRIMRGETKGGVWQSWWPLVLSFTLGLVFWGVIGWLGWLIWRAL